MLEMRTINGDLCHETLMYDEVLSVLLMYQRMITVRAVKGGHFGETVLLGRFPQNLTFISIVAVKINLGEFICFKLQVLGRL